MTERFTIVCPGCSRRLQSQIVVPAGRKMRCPHCRMVFRASTVSAGDTPPPAPRQRLVAGLVLGGLGVLMCLTIGLIWYLASHPEQPPADNNPSTEATEVADKSADDELLTWTPLTGLDRPPKHQAIEPRDDAESSVPWLTPERQAQVDAAIERGVGFLKQNQAASGTWSDDYHPAGLAALPALTLLECGIPTDDPRVSKALHYVRAAAPRLDTTYELALVLLFLKRHGDAADRPLIQRLALRLLAGQTAAGGWSYECPILPAEQEDKLLAVLEALQPASHEDLFVKELADPAAPDKVSSDGKQLEDLEGKAKEAYTALPPALQRLPSLRPPADAHQLPLADHSDNSNTQFAVLALWAAGRQGLPVERALALTATRFRFSQSLTGGWDYPYAVPSHSSTPAMTCAGLLGLAVGHGLIVQHRSHPTHAAQVDDDNVRRGMRALAGFVPPLSDSTDKKDRSAINLYYLWSLGRVALLYRTRQIDGKDWYAGAVADVLPWQEADGSWKANVYAEATPVLNTCFALLLLQRSHWTKELSKALQFDLVHKKIPQTSK
ncbi:MAG TPA: hypothetical protein VH682_17830 [Gemmataceae bacterium]